MKKVKNFVDYVESGRFEDQLERLSKKFEKAIILFLILAMAYFVLVFIKMFL